MTRTTAGQWIVAALVGVVFALFSDQFLAPPDCAFYWAWADAILHSLTLDFSGSFARLQIPQWYCYIVPETGRLANDWPMGTGLMVLPLAWAGPLAAHLWMIVLLATVLRWWWVTPIRASSSQKAAAIAALLTGTPLLFYGLFGPFFSHIPSFIACTAFLICWNSKTRYHHRSHFLSLGLLLGFAVLIRPQNALLALVFLFDWKEILKVTRAYGFYQVWRRMLMTAVGLLIGLLPRFYAQWAIYGNPFSLPKIEEMQWLSPNIIPMLFSDYHGMLPWTPLYILAVVGLISGAKERPRLYGALLVVFFSQLYINAANEVWWSGGSFGNRRMTDYSIVVAWGLMPLFAHKQRGVRATSMISSALCCAWTFTLLLAERRLLVPLDRYIPFNSPDFLPSLARVFTEPAETWHSLTRSLTAAYALAGLKKAIAIMLALIIIMRVPIDNVLLRHLGVAFLTFALIAQALVCVAALRTPRQPLEIIARTETESKILWDNYNELAGYYLIKQEWSRAQETAEKAIALRPDAFTGYWYKGMAQLEQGQLAEARASFAKVLELNPQHHNAEAILQEIDRALAFAPETKTPAGKSDWRVN